MQSVEFQVRSIDVGGVEHAMPLLAPLENAIDGRRGYAVIGMRDLAWVEHGLEDYAFLIVSQFVPISSTNFGVNLRQSSSIARVAEHVKPLHKHAAEMLHKPRKQHGRNGDDCGAPDRSFSKNLDVFFKFFRVIGVNRRAKLTHLGGL